MRRSARSGRGEQPTERFPEHPHDQAPARAGHPGHPGHRPRAGPLSARRRSRPESIRPRRRPGPGDKTRRFRPSSPTCCTQAGELAAVGSITWDGRPIAILGWACKMASNSHRLPKPMTQQLPPGGLGPAGAPGREHPRPALAAQPHPQAGPGQAKDREDEQRDEPLVQQRGLERRHHRRVVDVQPGVHSRHGTSRGGPKLAVSGSVQTDAGSGAGAGSAVTGEGAPPRVLASKFAHRALAAIPASHPQVANECGGAEERLRGTSKSSSVSRKLSGEREQSWSRPRRKRR